MYQTIAMTPFGPVRIDDRLLTALAARLLPVGVTCSAVRVRAADRLCLMVISDEREFWSREEDMRTARKITSELHNMGFDRPRLRWIRQTRFPHTVIPFAEEHSLYRTPFFWMNIFCWIYAFSALSLKQFAVFVAVGAAGWLISEWFITRGFSKIKNYFPSSRKRG